MTQPTYFRPTSDVGFHKIFCTEGNDELVIQLLNAVIDDKTILSFERLDPVHTVNTETYCTFDIYCKCDDGERIIVECQNRSFELQPLFRQNRPGDKGNASNS